MRPTADPRATSRSAVLSALLAGRPMERSEIVRATGLSRATVFRVLDDLQSHGLVHNAAAIARPGQGRPSTPAVFTGASKLVCGIDLGGTHARFAVADALGRTLVRATIPTPTDINGPDMGRVIARYVQRLVSTLSGDQGPLAALTIGVPGAVSGDKAQVVASHNLPHIVGTEFIESLRHAAGVPVSLDNDSNLALVGELRYGGLAKKETAVLLTLGTGLGSAVAIDGRILRGPAGLLGEFGRLHVPGASTRLRDLVSGAGLPGYARSLGYDVHRAQEILDTPQNYPDVYALVRDSLLHVVSLVALAYEPRTVTMTGGFADGLADSVLTEVQEGVHDLVGVRTRVRRTTLGDSAGLLGTLSVALGNLYASLGILEEHVIATDVDRRPAIAALDQAPVGDVGVTTPS